MARFVGGAGTLRNVGLGSVEQHMVFELAYPPFAYVLSIDETTPAVASINITDLSDVSIHETISVELQLLLGYGHTAFPLDYRPKAAVVADRAGELQA
jgi:hypothetical protein